VNVGVEDLSRLDILFKVPKSWIHENEVDKGTVKLFMLVDGQWQPLSTEVIGETAEFVGYRASVVGRTIYAIAGEKLMVAPTPGVTGLPLLILLILAASVIGTLYIIKRMKAGF